MGWPLMATENRYNGLRLTTPRSPDRVDPPPLFVSEVLASQTQPRTKLLWERHCDNDGCLEVRSNSQQPFTVAHVRRGVSAKLRFESM